MNDSKTSPTFIHGNLSSDFSHLDHPW
jgi:hypothetical protein